MEQLNIIKTLLGDSSELFSDEQLNVFIEQAKNEFLIYCNRTEVPTAAEPIINNLVVYKCNRLGTEGLTSQSFSGVSDAFIDGYPADITKQLNHFRKLKLL